MDTSAATDKRDYRWILAGVIVFGVAAAWIGLGRPSLWLDESFTWWFTTLGWEKMLRAVRLDGVNPPLYYLYVKALAPGTSEAALRLPSVLAHAVGIGAAAALGKRLGGMPGAATAGLIWAAHPLTLWAARDARPYALAAALAAFGFCLYLSPDRGSNPWRSALRVAVLAAGLMTHYFFFVFAASLILDAGLQLRRDAGLFRRWTLVTLAGMIPMLGWLVWFFSTGPMSLGIGWIRQPTPVDVPLTLWNLISGYAGVTDPASWFVGAVVGLMVAAGLSSALGRRLAVTGLLAPISAVWLISQRRPVYVDRYFLVLMPFLAAQAALGAGRIAAGLANWPRARRTLSTAVLTALASAAAAAGIFAVHTAPKFAKEDWRGLARHLQTEGADSTALSMSEPEAALPLTRYFDPTLLDAPPSEIPHCAGACWWVVRQPYTATHALTQAVSEPGRQTEPQVPPGCSRSSSWSSPTGLSAFALSCDG